ncbi:MAG: 2-dehydropantoate 2-reductase [Candidatus Jordarchaeales archaeon]
MKIAVLGAGAIGSLFGGMLAKSGVDVVLIGREKHVKAIRNNGLRIEGERETFTVKVEAFTNVLDVGKVDVVFLTVKAYDTKNAAADAKHLMRKDSIVVCMQNGLGTEKEAAEVLGEKNILRGITSEGAQLIEPGVVRHTGRGESFIGPPFGPPPEGAEKVVELLRMAGFNAAFTNNIEREVWGKVLVNAGINPLGAITGLRNGEIVENKLLLEVMKKIISEGEEVATKHGIRFLEKPFEKAVKIARMTARNKNSMLQDLEKGKRTEIDYINGAIVVYGEKYGVKTPINFTVTAIVKTLEAKFARKA